MLDLPQGTSAEVQSSLTSFPCNRQWALEPKIGMSLWRSLELNWFEQNREVTSDLAVHRHFDNKGMYWGRKYSFPFRNVATMPTSSAASVQRGIVCAEVQAWEFMAFCFFLPAGDVSLHLTTFSLQYTPPVVACVCIHLACKWSNWEIPVSTDGKHWWEYVDGTVTLELLDGKFWSKVPPKKALLLSWHLFLGVPFTHSH